MEDEQEVRAASGLDSWSALEISRLSSQVCLTVLLRDVPAVMFGVRRDSEEPTLGGVWMLAADSLLDFQWLFLRECRGWLGRAAHGCEITWNVVDCRNRLHIRWLNWMGYKMLRVIPDYGAEKRPFIEFFRREADHV